MNIKVFPRPVQSSLAWGGLMFIVAISFLGFKLAWSRLAEGHSESVLVRDQLSSMGLLVAISLVVGFCLAWVCQGRVTEQNVEEVG